MKRKLWNFGIFRSDICIGGINLRKEEKEIYAKLLEAGFRETKWQFIYQDQKAGLVLPYSDGNAEIHIRFYEDRIFSEIEIGRASPLHFLFPLFNANRYVSKLLEDRISPQCAGFFRSMTEASNFMSEEAALEDWDFRNNPNPYAQLRNINDSREWSLPFKAHNLLRWNNLALAAAFLDLSAVISMGGGIVWAAPAAFVFAAILITPTIGKP